jgi:hypothetical protein
MGRNLWFGLGLVIALLGTAAPDAHAKGSVRITFTTQPSGGNYAPNNVVAAWIQNAGGTHQRTVGIWSAVRTIYLRSYVAAVTTIENNLPADAVSGASRLNHTGQLTVLWNLKDKAGNVVPDGTYTIRLELADRNSTAANQNNQGTFTFVKGPTAQVQTALANGGFTNVTVDYDPNRVACGDGIVDASESCDWTVAGSCIVNQSGCATADRCMPTVFTGDPMLCTADCVPAAPITECKSNDGCCLDTCTEANDNDCRPGGGSGSNTEETPDENLSGGCSSGAGGGVFVFALFALTLLVRRKK